MDAYPDLYPSPLGRLRSPEPGVPLEVFKAGERVGMSAYPKSTRKMAIES